MRIYLSGAITGTKDHEKRFQQAEEEVRKQFPEAEIINMASVTRPLNRTAKSLEHKDYMAMSFLLLGKCDAIYMIPGWEQSRGANQEYGYAVAKGMKILGAKE